MPVNVSRIKQKLAALDNKLEMVNWKMNVNLPKGVLDSLDFDNTCKIVEEGIYKFWKQYRNNCPMDVEQIWHNFEGQNRIPHEFKILGFDVIKTDHRDDSEDTKSSTAIRVSAEIECKASQKQTMLVKDPLTLSFSGSLVRNKKTNKLISITFKSLMVDDGVVIKALMET